MPVVTLGRRASSGPTDDPTVLLGDCHARIRHQCATASRLVTAEAPTDDQVREAAAEVHRYFTLALPLHEADEETDLDPMLRAHAPRKEIIDALDRIVADHRALEAMLADLLAGWHELSTAPAARRRVTTTIAQATSALSTRFDEHLALEETLVFPAIRALPEAERLRLRDAIRDRRAASMQKV